MATSGDFHWQLTRWLKQWAAAGPAERLHALALPAYDQVIGLQLEDVAVAGCISKAPGGARSPAVPRSIAASRAANAR